MVISNTGSSLFRSTPAPRKQVAKNTPLPDDFKPNEWTVICGRGRECFNHVGNRRFRCMLESYRQAYIDAPTRTDKSMIVIEIVNNFRRAMPLGAFVKKNPKTLKWFDVGDQQARDKVGHAIREATAGAKAAAKKEAASSSATASNNNNKKDSSRRAASEGTKLTNAPKPLCFTKSISMPPKVPSSSTLDLLPEPVSLTSSNKTKNNNNKRSVSAPTGPVSMVDVLADISSALARARSEHSEFVEKRDITPTSTTDTAPCNNSYIKPIQAKDAMRNSLRLSIDATMGSLLLDALDLDEADCFLLEDFGGVDPDMRL